MEKGGATRGWVHALDAVRLRGAACGGGEWGLVDGESLVKEMINCGDDMSSAIIMIDTLAKIRHRFSGLSSRQKALIRIPRRESTLYCWFADLLICWFAATVRRLGSAMLFQCKVTFYIYVILKSAPKKVFFFFFLCWEKKE